MSIHTTNNEIPLEFADESARMSYEIAARVKHLDATLPPEPSEYIVPTALEGIRFASSDEDKGQMVLFFAGDFLNANEDGTVFFVRPRTLRILDAIDVPYHPAPRTSHRRA